MALINGIDTGKLEKIKEDLKKNPENAKAKPSVKTVWLGGMKSVTKIRDFEVKVDEPVELSGSNTAQTPTETLLASLGACLAVGYATNAALMGVEIKKMEIDIDGEVDRRGFFGLDLEKTGFQGIRAKVNIVSDATDEQLQRLHEITLKTSPVGCTLINSKSVSVQLVNSK